MAEGSHQGEELLSLLWLGQCCLFVIKMATFGRSQLQNYFLYSVYCGRLKASPCSGQTLAPDPLYEVLRDPSCLALLIASRTLTPY